MNRVTFTREQLYDLIWSESLLTLSKKYNISDVGLRKICIRMDIPLPMVGYWNKVKAGKSVEVKELSSNYEGEKEISLALRVEGENQIEDGLSPQMALQKELEIDPNTNLKVPDVLSDPDPIVEKAQKVLNEFLKRTKGEKLEVVSLHDYIKTTLKNMNRALLIMDTFVKAMRKRGHEFNIENGECYVLLNGKERMKMTLKENQTIVESQDRWRSREYLPTGILSFIFEHYGTTASCRDGKEIIENQLAKIIAKLEILSKRLEKERLANEEWHRKYKEERKKQQEFEERKQLELNTFKQTLSEAERCHEATLVRKYADQIEQKAINEGRLTEEVTIQLNWIRKKADWYDPLVKGHDDWLDAGDRRKIYQNDNNSYQTPYYQRTPEVNEWPLTPWYIKK